MEETKPKRRRYRIPRSCDRCRTSKIKCVFQDGRCLACANARVPCTFANPGSLKERPPTQKDVEHLQARIRSLERLIHAIDPEFDLSSLPEPVDPEPKKKSISVERGPSQSSISKSQYHHSASSFLENHDPRSDPILTSLFFPSQLKLSASAGNLPFSLVNVDGMSPVDKIIRHEFSKATYWKYVYPEPDLERSLMELYFRHIHPYLPLIHPATFLEDLNSGLSNTSDSFRALCLIMMAVSSRFSRDARVFLDLDDRSQPTAGLRYAVVVGSYCFQPMSTPADLHDLQTILLLVVYALGTASPEAAWDIVGLGLQRAQEMGAHLEKSPNWISCPLQDHLRRKTFVMLYEFDCFLSGSIGKPPYMQESDFDVLPHDLDFEKEIGTFKNPFDDESTNKSEEGGKFIDDLGPAYLALKSSFAGLKNLFPLMDVMKARKEACPNGKISNCIEPLIDQLDSSMTKCYQKIAIRFAAHQSNLASVTDSQLISSVNAVTWYHEFRLLTHKILFNYKGNKNNTGVGETKPNIKKESDDGIEHQQHQGEDVRKTSTMNPHAQICIQSARMIVGLMDRLHKRNLLELGFYWIPLRLTNALIILIISLKKFNKILSPEQRNLTMYEISLGIQILNVLAPSTFLAARCSKVMIQFQDCLLRRGGSSSSNKKSSPSSSASPPIVPSSEAPSSL